jgi:hypothetical protein
MYAASVSVYKIIGPREMSFDNNTGIWSDAAGEIHTHGAGSKIDPTTGSIVFADENLLYVVLWLNGVQSLAMAFSVWSGERIAELAKERAKGVQNETQM